MKMKNQNGNMRNFVEMGAEAKRETETEEMKDEYES